MNYSISISEDRAHHANTAMQNTSSTYSLPRSMYGRFSEIYDTVFPINVATNSREFGYLPKFISEKQEDAANNLYNYMRVYRHFDKEMENRFEKIFDSLFLHVSNKQINKPFIFSSKKFTTRNPNLGNSLPLQAMTLFGGRIIFSKELIESIDAWDYSKEEGVTKEDVLAAALGHEMAHADIDHLTKCTAQVIAGESLFSLLTTAVAYFTGTLSILNGIAFLPFYCIFSCINKLNVQQEAEREADKYGIELIHKAGYNTKGSLTLQKVLKNEFENNPMVGPWAKKMRSWEISTHPSFESRIKANQETIKEIARREIASKQGRGKKIK